VSDALQSQTVDGIEEADDSEVVDALPVLAHEAGGVPARPGEGVVSRPSSVVIPAVQAVAVAAGGFVAGAAVVGLVQRRQRQSAPPSKSRRLRGSGRGRGAPSPGELVQIVSSRSLLVDVHLLGNPGGER
jgi:hypothetical protein